MMIKFDSQNPFLLRAEGDSTYAEEQAHSVEVDQFLGFDIEPIEKSIERDFKVQADQQLWIGLGTQKLQTPYLEIRRLLEKINPRPGETIVDLGAAYGRMAFVIERHFPDVGFIGYECVEERVREANRVFALHNLTRSRMEKADLAHPDFQVQAAPYYFLFDYGTRRAIEKTLQDLKSIARTLPITVVGRGRASRDAIERGHPWLAGVKAPEHFAHFSIYKS